MSVPTANSIAISADRVLALRAVSLVSALDALELLLLLLDDLALDLLGARAGQRVSIVSLGVMTSG